MAQDWGTPSSYSATPVQPPMAAAYALRPLSLGELLDRTFSVYRANFWLFAGIGAISALVKTLISAVQLIPLNRAGAVGVSMNAAKSPLGFPRTAVLPNYLTNLGMGALLGFLVVIWLYLLVFVVTQAATVHAVSEVYLGRPMTIGESLRATIGRWYRYLGIGLWQGGSAIWPPMVGLIAGGVLTALGMGILGVLVMLVGFVGGFVVGAIFWLRNSLGVQATVIEGLTVRASMARSKVLTAGSKGRIFVLVLLSVALSYAAALLQMPLSLIMMFSIARGGKPIATEMGMLLVGFVGQAAVQPVLMIGLSLLYFDQRVRKEAFDLMMLLGPEYAPVVAVEPAVWPPVVAAETPVWPPPVATPVEAAPMYGTISVPAITTEPISTEPIVVTPSEEPVRPRTDDETLA
jgi:hypothetical protein